MGRKVSLWVVLLIVWAFCGFIVLFSWSVWHISNGGSGLGSFGKVVISIAKFPTTVKEAYSTITHKSFLIIEKFPNIQSIREKHKINDDGYVLLSSYDKKYGQSAVNLIRLSDSKCLHTWILSLDQLKKKHIILPGIGRNNFRMVHPLLTEDGSIVFQCLFSPLISLDLNSNVNWIIKGKFNHSIESDADGAIWVPMIIDSSHSKPDVIKLYYDDGLGKVSPGGKLLSQNSISEILIDNGYRALLLGISPINYDQVHLNSIRPALSTTKYWQKGDLLISLRNLSTVFLYRPENNKIIWLKTGPWLNQHDVDFIDSTKISIFGNNMIRSNVCSKPNFLISGHNEVYVYDFATSKVTTPYTEFLAKSKVSTLTEGLAQVLENGDIFVEETNFGRLLRGNRVHEIWSLVDRIDAKSISMLSWCRYISKKEFEKRFSKINFNAQ